MTIFRTRSITAGAQQLATYCGRTLDGGLALAETTPGPLIIFLQFIGFMSRYNASGSFGFAVLCALLTTYFIFLPSYLYFFAGANYIERLLTNRYLTTVLFIRDGGRGRRHE